MYNFCSDEIKAMVEALSNMIIFHPNSDEIKDFLSAKDKCERELKAREDFIKEDNN
tara:strand:+ start:374 stop:541 length:168 start_codon:yes stop_codon:yes gene_type:complete